MADNLSIKINVNFPEGSTENLAKTHFLSAISDGIHSAISQRARASDIPSGEVQIELKLTPEVEVLERHHGVARAMVESTVICSYGDLARPTS